MAAHAKLSASGASRWINCPGSVVMESKYPDSSSEFAEEGTLAHALAEAYLRNWLYKDSQKDIIDRIKQAEMYSISMHNYVNEYVDYIRDVVLSYPSMPLVSIEERVDFSIIVPEGFGTADCVIIYGDEMHIIDLKYGKGVEVPATNNPQLRLYAIGAYYQYSLVHNIEKITTHIVQPRLKNISTETLSTDELLAFADTIKPIAQEAYKGSDKLKSGDHCKFCKAKQNCVQRAKEMFSAFTEVDPFRDTDAKELTEEQLSFILNKTEGIAKWISDVEDLALKRILSGAKIDGFKAVEGRSNRTLRDVKTAFGILVGAGFNEDDLYERKPLTLTKLESLVGKKEFGNLLKDEIIKPQGKPTLVKATDKRKDFVIDAKELFKDVMN